MNDHISRCQYRVIYGDTDQMGVVYYGNYLRFFERGRCEFLRDLNVSYQALEDHGYILPIVDAHVKYRVPARFDDLLTIETRIAKTSRVRATFAYRITRDDDGGETLIAEGETVLACLTKAGRPARFPQAWLDGEMG